MAATFYPPYMVFEVDSPFTYELNINIRLVLIFCDRS